MSLPAHPLSNINPKNYIGFIDETGILHDPNQRFFALGLLKMNDASLLYTKMWKVKNDAISSLRRGQSKKDRPKTFEFKFNQINNSDRKFYIKMVDTYFSLSNLHFCCFIIDKKDPNIDVTLFDAWDYYIKYSITMLKNNLKKDENIFVIADFLGKPNRSDDFWENAITSIPNVYNAIMLESHASLFIQMVDIFIGAVSYDYKINRQGQKPNKNKIAVCNKVQGWLGRKSLLGTFTVNKPSYFNVWEFSPKR